MDFPEAPDIRDPGGFKIHLELFPSAFLEFSLSHKV